ncbi:MAG TPA: diguanylate cyclase [Anaerolineales bacterium]|nr:diguanylate cyclase [Anaerolineales bacterium]
MPRKRPAKSPTGYVVLLVDDNAEYLEASRMLLENEGHSVLCAGDGAGALEIVRERHVDLMLLDYYMPKMTGEQVVAKLREFNPLIQVILQTGYASEQPPRELLRRLDIQGYYDKSEGPDKLLLWTDVGLKAAYAVQLLEMNRRGLRYILDATPDLHRIQPLEDLLHGVLWQMAGLLHASDTFLAVVSGEAHPTVQPEAAETFVAMVNDDLELSIRAGTGRFSDRPSLGLALPDDERRAIQKAMEAGRTVQGPRSTIVPLSIRETSLGVIFLEAPGLTDQNQDLLRIFANQAAVAIQNTQLYERATLDSLTGVFGRGFFEDCLRRELRAAFRSAVPLVVLMLDVDDMKAINDTRGHLAGDHCLSTLGRLLRSLVRENDVVGRYGGDEFAFVLTRTDIAEAQIVAQRVLEAVGRADWTFEDMPVSVSCSLGLAELPPHRFEADSIPRPLPHEYFERMAQVVIERADGALYQAKRGGGQGLRIGESADWLDIVLTPG